jgi:hypothetical protein
MSRIFYDDLLDLQKVEKGIKKVAKTKPEQEELWQMVDEIVHHRLLGCILTHLPDEHHSEFLHHFSSRPHDENLFHYLQERISHDVKEFLKAEIRLISAEVMTIIAEHTEPSARVIKSKKK